jgi:AcrR family transcriptional regulator
MPVTRPNPHAPSSGKTVRRTQTERRTATERALLTAARRLIASRGVDRTSVADVGEAAGYSRGSVNHRFGSKQALLQRLARDTQQSVEATFRQSDVYPLTPSVPALDSMVALTEVYLEWVTTHESEARAFFAMWGSAFADEALVREEFGEFDHHFRDSFALLVRVGQANHSVRADVEPFAVSVAVVGMIRGIAAQWMITPDVLDLRSVRRTVELFIRETLGPPT